MNDNEKNVLSYVRLQFHIDTPLVEEIWLEGYEFAQKELDDSTNPYTQGTREYHYWNEGWWAGFYKESPLFTLDGLCPQGLTLAIQSPASHTAFYASIVPFFLTLAKNQFLVTLYKLSTALLASFMVYELIGSMT